MSAWLTAILTKLAASLAHDLLEAAGRRVKRAFQTKEQQKALAHCLQAALGALIEEGFRGEGEPDRAHVQDVLERFAAEEQAQDELLNLWTLSCRSGPRLSIPPHCVPNSSGSTIPPR